MRKRWWLVIIALWLVTMEIKAEQSFFPLDFHDHWPRVYNNDLFDIDLERRVSKILKEMTLEEKIGQMIQPDLREVSPQEAAQYKLGSLLNGGGAWPNDNKYALAQDWVTLADTYYEAVENAFVGRGFKIPFMWATDAVHGHNNVFGATVFPHNIGLGAARDPDLIRRIGEATAKEVLITGLDWTFSPTVAVPQDYRWGRVYEGYSQDPSITYQYSQAMVLGLQGSPGHLAEDDRVISTLKHWVGDGGTVNGIDRGVNEDPEVDLINTHSHGYFAGIHAGAMAVMTSFNSWVNDRNYSLAGYQEYNYKAHGSKYLVTDILKDKLGFDGLVITDWNGHSEISGCTSDNCPNVVLAGNDIIMVTANADWKAFFANLLSQVRSGIIPLDRIDDAVTRILRVKMRAGLWEKPRPRLRTFAGRQDLLGSENHRSLAREAVRKSLVLLKNQQGFLPLAPDKNYLVVGSAANDIQKQTGGWSLTWQGNENEGLTDFPGATTVLASVVEKVGADRVFTSVDDAPEDAIAIVVIGEDPYAEMFGDIGPSKTLEYAALKKTYKADLLLLGELKGLGYRIVTVFFSGRPLYVNDILNDSMAFIAGWLPGSEGRGVTDLLFSDGTYDFSGRLSFPWPRTKCQIITDQVGMESNESLVLDPLPGKQGMIDLLFPLGYGLSYDENKSTTYGIDSAVLDLDERDYGCGLDSKDRGVASSSLKLFGVGADDEFTMFLSGASTNWVGVKTSRGSVRRIAEVSVSPIDFIHQQDGLRVVFQGAGPGQIYLSPAGDVGVDLQRYVNANSVLKFEISASFEDLSDIVLAMHCGWPCRGEVRLSDHVSDEKEQSSGGWITIEIPLAKFVDEGMTFTYVTSPFLLFSESKLEFLLGMVELVPGSEL